MPILGAELELSRCPHCRVDKPSLSVVGVNLVTTDYNGNNKRMWKNYKCRRCGGIVTAWATDDGKMTHGIYPDAPSINESIPSPARDYIRQAMDTLHSPAGSVMLSASAVDAMLKAKGYKEGTLYSRINKAAEDHIITTGMAEWAHAVRLDANDQRHADEDSPLPDPDNAKRSVCIA
ncbi:MAG: DUF4145 domain-containing protein [Chloroflexi bacterium]|nr:DUF4145 domain-containing protein [Chloroflexota bacterium]